MYMLPPATTATHVWSATHGAFCSRRHRGTLRLAGHDHAGVKLPGCLCCSSNGGSYYQCWYQPHRSSRRESIYAPSRQRLSLRHAHLAVVYASSFIVRRERDYKVHCRWVCSPCSCCCYLFYKTVGAGDVMSAQQVTHLTEGLPTAAIDLAGHVR